MERHITLPLTREEARTIKSGEQLLLSGVIYTARDAAHKRLCELVEKGEPLPFDLTGIDFAMTALFIVIFTEQWLSYPTHLPAILGFICAVISLVIFGPSNFILPALIVTVTLLFVCRRYLEPFTKEEEHP